MATDPARARGGDFFSSWLRLALVRDGLVFLTFLVGLLVVLVFGFQQAWAERNVATVSGIIAGNLGTLAAAVERLPEGAREPFVRRVAELSQGALQVQEPAPGSLREPPGFIRETGIRLVRQMLPGETIAYSTGPSDAYWMALHGAGGQALWVKVPILGTTAQESTFRLATLALLAPVALLGGLALLAQQRRRLAGHAALAAGPGRGARMFAQAPGWTRLAALYVRAPAASREPLAQLAQSWEGLQLAQPPAGPWPTPRAGSAMGLVRDIAALAGLSLLLLGAAGWAADRLVLRPRFEDAGDILAVQIRGMRAVAAALPPEQRAAFVRDLSRISHGRIEVSDASRWTLLPPTRALQARMVEHVRAGLPGVAVATSRDPATLWVQLPWAQSDGGWLRMLDSPRLVLIGLGLLASVAGAAVLGAVLVVLHGRRRAAQVARAIEGGEPDLGLQGEALLLLSTDAELRRRWAESLAGQGQQEAARAQRLRDARAQLSALRQLRPPGADGVEALQLLDTMATALSGLEREAGVPPALDLDALVSELAGVARAPVAVATGGLPWLHLRRADTLRLLHELFTEVLAQGGEVHSALEQGEVVLRFRGAGAREPALASARQQAQALGGTIREERLQDGRSLVELWLPVSRT